MQLWPQDAQKIIARAQTKTFAEKISKFVTGKIHFKHMQLAVNNEILKRLKDGMHGRGIQRLKTVMQGDLSNARKRMDLTPVIKERLALFNLALDKDGFCCQYGHSVQCWPTPSSLQDTPVPDAMTNADADTDESPQPEKRKLFDNDTTMQDEAEEATEDESESEAEQVETPIKKPRITSLEPASCGCLVRRTVLSDCLSKTDNASTESALVAFRAIVRPIRNAGRVVNTDTLCAEHAKRLYKILGLYANGAYAEMTHRLDVLYSRCGNWDAAKKEYAEWFKQPTGSDVASCFRFEPKSLSPTVEEFDTLQYLTIEDLFLRCFGIAKDSQARATARAWEKDGSVVLPLFSWLSEN